MYPRDRPLTKARLSPRSNRRAWLAQAGATGYHDPMDGFMRAASLGLAGFALWAAGCGGPQEPAEEGADCFRDADCKPGLVCVPNSSGARTCSDDISGLVSQVEQPPPPPDAGMPMDDAAAPMDDGAAPMDPPADGG